MNLNDFFLPLNLATILELVFFLVIFDIIGFSIRRGILILSRSEDKDISFLRLVDWWWGACIFTAIWVGIHFFAPFSKSGIWVSASLLALACSQVYLRNKAPSTLLSELVQITKRYWLAIIPLLILLKPMYFRLSLPPSIWDELAYHIWSPARVIFEQHWEFVLNRFTNVIYEMFPRTWETLMILMFSATHSYAVGKFFQVLLLISIVFLFARIFSDLCKNKNLVSNFWIFFILLLERGMVYQAGTAYIDVGAAASMLLVVSIGWLWLQEPTRYKLLLLCLGIGAAMGTKYSVLPGILSVVLVIGLLNLSKWKLLKQITIKQWLTLVLYSSALWFIAGGHWYVKNLLVAGNPFWPFFNYALGIKDCCDGRMVIEGWGYIPFTYESRWHIVDSVFQKGQLYLWILSFAVIAIGWLLNRKEFAQIFKFYLFLILLMAVEVLFSLKDGLFVPRFYLHWYLYKSMWLVLPLALIPAFPKRTKKALSTKVWKNWDRLKSSPLQQIATILIAFGWLIILISFIGKQLPLGTIEKINNLSEFEMNENDRWVVRQKMTIEEWIHPIMPHAFPMIEYCSNLNDGQQEVYSADVEAIIGYITLSRVYLARCLLKEIIALPSEAPAQTSARIIKAKPDLIYFSSLTCKQLKDQNINNLNSEFACAGEQFAPQLYRFPTATQ